MVYNLSINYLLISGFFSAHLDWHMFTPMRSIFLNLNEMDHSVWLPSIANTGLGDVEVTNSYLVNVSINFLANSHPAACEKISLSVVFAKFTSLEILLEIFESQLQNQPRESLLLHCFEY